MILKDYGQLGELLLDGGNWHIHRNGIESRGKSVLWKNVEEIYISGSVSTVEHFVPAGEKRTIKIVDSRKNNVKISLSGFFQMSESQKREFTSIYSFILQNIASRQWEQFLQRILGGEQVSFGVLDISNDGIYYQKMFGRELIGAPSVRGWDIRNGSFYLQYVQTDNRPAEKTLYFVENIPNIHILQAFIKQISEENLKRQ